MKVKSVELEISLNLTATTIILCAALSGEASIDTFGKEKRMMNNNKTSLLFFN